MLTSGATTTDSRICHNPVSKKPGQVHGIALGWAIDGASRNDVHLLEPTIASNGWLDEVDTLHLDSGYDYPKIRRQLAAAGLDEHVIQRRRQPGDH